jgi:hypothetical protein
VDVPLHALHVVAVAEAGTLPLPERLAAALDLQPPRPRHEQEEVGLVAFLDDVTLGPTTRRGAPGLYDRRGDDDWDFLDVGQLSQRLTGASEGIVSREVENLPPLSRSLVAPGRQQLVHEALEADVIVDRYDVPDAPQDVAGRTLVDLSAAGLRVVLSAAVAKEVGRLMQLSRPFDGFVEYAKPVSPTCLVHLDRNRFSVPASFANRPVSLRVYPERFTSKLSTDPSGSSTDTAASPRPGNASLSRTLACVDLPLAMRYWGVTKRLMKGLFKTPPG